MNDLSFQKKKKITIIAIATIIVVLSILLAIVLAINSGDEVLASVGEDNTTHQTIVPNGYVGIYNTDDLVGISSDSSNLTKNYILMADIDLSGIDFEPIGQSSSSPFKGILDGNNYKIINLNINSTNQYVGLFGFVNAGTIRDLTLENATVTSTYTQNTAYVGALAGYTTNLTVENVSIIGASKIENIEEGTNERYIGGLVGYCVWRKY